MGQVNSLTISKSVTSSTRAINIGEVIRSGDTAVTLEITWSDVTAITGTVNLHFVLANGTVADRDASDGVVLAGNKVTCLLESGLIATEGLLTMYVQFTDSNLFTPLKVSLSGVKLVPGGVSIPTTQVYPAWVPAIQTAEGLRVIAESARVVAEGDRVDEESDRVIAEGLRVIAEGDRVDEEALRVIAEGSRVSAEGTRVTSENARNAWHASYDAGHAYLVGEKVAYNGSSYVCFLNSTGNLPTNGTYFTLIAQAGAAGTINTSTLTNLTGVIAGDGTNIRAVTATDAGNLPMSDPGNYYAGDDKLLTQMQAVGNQLAQIISPPLIVTSENLFDKTNANNLDGKMLAYNTGSLSNYAPCTVTHYIGVNPGDTVFAYLDVSNFGGAAQMHFYDDSYTWIGREVPTFSGEIGNATVPANAKYLRFNIVTSKLPIVMAVVGAAYPDAYIPHKKYFNEVYSLNYKQYAEAGNNLLGKIAIFDGDSIANAINDALDGYAGRITSKYSMPYTNYAVDGGVIASGLVGRHCVCESVSGYRSDAEYIVFEGGTNDADLLGIGNIGDISTGFDAVLDTTKFTGAVESTLKQAIIKYPGKKIGFLIAHKMGSLEQQTARKQFFDRIVDCCKKWGVPYVNIWETCHLNPLIPSIASVYYSDNQHLTSVGYDVVASIIDKWMLSL